jgi:hypothetical protein
MAVRILEHLAGQLRFDPHAQFVSLVSSRNKIGKTKKREVELSCRSSGLF